MNGTEKHRMLLVEDDPDLSQLFVDLFESRGYVVSQAANGRDALDQMVAGAFDVVLTDIYMPEMDGLEFIRECRRIDKKVALIAISGGGSTFDLDMLPLAKRMGANQVLRKPVKVDVLLQAVTEALEERPGD